MNAIQVISLTLLSALAVNAQVLMPGRCPKLAVQENFDTARVNTSIYSGDKAAFLFHLLYFEFQKLTN